MDAGALKRFWSKVEKTDGCWVWKAACNNKGYGVFYDPRKPNKNKMGYAHRMIYEHAVGPIPEDKEMCHRCDNPKCVNPSHLFVGTRKENMVDCSSKGRTRNGVRRGKDNHNTKLNEQAVREIRAVVNPNVCRLARKYGVTRNPIKQVLDRVTWKHVT